MAQNYSLDIKHYKELCEACMLVIKQKYDKAIIIFTKLYAKITGDEKKKACAAKEIEKAQE